MKNQFKNITAASLLITALFLTSFISIGNAQNFTPPKEYTYKVINTYLHDTLAFTQGLVFDGGILYESTGLKGHSTLRQVTLEKGIVIKSVKLPYRFFGEGITIFENRIIQLTNISRTGFVYDKITLDKTDTFSYATEGWGITHNDKSLIMSDGSSNLYFMDPDTFEVEKILEVTSENKPVKNINELEYINGLIYANIWLTDLIAIISPDTGKVTGWVNMKGLLSAEDANNARDVLNGIAYDKENNRIFVTGKFWPKLFEIQIIPIEDN